MHTETCLQKFFEVLHCEVQFPTLKLAQNKQISVK